MKSLSKTKLLVDSKGNPLEFSCPMSVPHEIRSEIRENGGIVVKRNANSSNIIRLIHHQYKGDEHCVSVKFVIDSIKRKELQNIADYEFNRPSKSVELHTDESRPTRRESMGKSYNEDEPRPARRESMVKSYNEDEP